MPLTPSEPVKVLIVDDSTSARAMLRSIVEKDPGLTVMGTAPDAFAASAQARAGAARPDAPSARDLFPDIDEINSTLRDTGDRSGQEADASDIDTLDTVPRRRRGTRIGFFGVIAIAAIAAALYANSDQIAGAMPAAAPAVAVFVETVDAGRVWLDDLVRGLVGAVTEG